MIEYLVPADASFERFGFKIPESAAQSEASASYKAMNDQALFDLTKMAKYPDYFYRIRTALSTVGAKYPSEIMVSFRPTYASMGFKLPGGAEVTSAGFHGSLEELGTAGTLLTTERMVPEAVRSDNFLELFPRMKEHLKGHGLDYVEGDPNSMLKYE